MKKQSTKSSLDKTTKQQQINNEQNQGENMDNGISLRNNMILSTTYKNPVEMACPQKNSDETFTETRKSRRLKKFFPLDIKDFDLNNDIKDDEIEDLVNNISCNINVNRGKQRKIKKEENFNSVTIPSFGLNKSLKEPHKKVKPINNIETFQDENIEMYEETTHVKQDSRLKTIKQNVFEEPKMKLKTEIDQYITKPSLFEDNFNPKKTVMNELALPKQHSKTNTEFYETEEENMDYMDYKKLFFITYLGLIKKEKGKINSKSNVDGIKPKSSQQTSQYLKELSIPYEDNTKKAYQTRPVKKKHSYSKTYSNKRENNQMFHIPIVGPEKLLGSAVHPERFCKPHCRMCSIKFGSLDIPRHITEIKNPMTSDFENKCLTNHGVKVDSCLCGPCFRIIKRKNYGRIIQQEICIVTTCNSLATEIFESLPMDTIRCNLIEKGIKFKTWTNGTKSIAICEIHLKEILKLTECHLCGSQSQEKFSRRMFPLYIYRRVFEIIEISIKLDAKSLICENCHFFFINHIVYNGDYSGKIYMEIRSDILTSICKYKNMELPEFFFTEEWPWNYVQPEGTPSRQPPTATQISFILSVSLTTPIDTWRRTLNQLTSDDIRWTVMPQGAQRPKWVSLQERIALAAAAGLLPGVPVELEAVGPEASDTPVADADGTAVVRPEETTAQPSDEPPSVILDVGDAGQTQTERRDDVVAPAIPILTLPKTSSTKWMQLPMSSVDDIMCKTTEVCETAVGDVDHTKNEPASIVVSAELSSSKDIAEVASAAAAFAPICGGDDTADTTLAGVDSDTVTAALAYTTTAAAAAFVLVDSVPGKLAVADDGGGKQAAADDGGDKRAAADGGDGQSVPPSKLAKFSESSGQISTALADASETDIIYPEHGQPASADGAILRK